MNSNRLDRSNTSYNFIETQDETYVLLFSQYFGLKIKKQKNTYIVLIVWKHIIGTYYIYYFYPFNSVNEDNRIHRCINFPFPGHHMALIISYIWLNAYLLVFIFRARFFFVATSRLALLNVSAPFGFIHCYKTQDVSTNPDKAIASIWI